MKVKLDAGAKMPTRAHTYDAGLDLYSPVDAVLVAQDSVVIDTGVHLKIPEGCVGLVKSKSGLMMNFGIVTDGTVDSGYTGSIRVKLFNHGFSDYYIKPGEKVAQIVIVPCVLLPLEKVDTLEETDRGCRGFGSSGRF